MIHSYSSNWCPSTHGSGPNHLRIEPSSKRQFLRQDQHASSPRKGLSLIMSEMADFSVLRALKSYNILLHRSTRRYYIDVLHSTDVRLKNIESGCTCVIALALPEQHPECGRSYFMILHSKEHVARSLLYKFLKSGLSLDTCSQLLLFCCGVDVFNQKNIKLSAFY